jgi:hypothetical protein
MQGLHRSPDPRLRKDVIGVEWTKKVQHEWDLIQKRFDPAGRGTMLSAYQVPESPDNSSRT